MLQNDSCTDGLHYSIQKADLKTYVSGEARVSPIIGEPQNINYNTLKGSICSFEKKTDTAFWHCTADIV